MPLYEYECDKCGQRFERIQKFSDPLVEVCPHCEGPVRKLISSPAIQFKGTGWYVTDYGRKGQGGEEAGAKGGDQPSAAADTSKEGTSSEPSTSPAAGSTSPTDSSKPAAAKPSS